MTSGTFHNVLVSSVVIDRQNRQRRELTGIEELGESIARTGLIHPIVITRDNVLVVGERRITAIKSLGWSHIPAQYTDELDQNVLHLIELEENIRRTDIPWQDQVDAMNRYHKAKLELESEWSTDKTAEELGVAPTKVRKNIMLAKEMERNPTIATLPKFSVALGVAQRQNDRRMASEIRTIAAPPTSAVLNLDFNAWSDTYAGPPFNFIHCDFPYGIGADKFDQGGAKAHGGYVDSADTYWTLCRSLARNLERVADESCHIIFWYSMKFHSETFKFLTEETDFVINPYPLVWHKTDGAGILPDPSRGPRQCYEVAFFGHRGDRKIVRAKSNIYGAPTVRDKHMSEKPEPMLSHFFEMVVDGNTRILDPTAGSGSALRAAKKLNAASILGLEVNREFAERANAAIGPLRAEG